MPTLDMTRLVLLGSFTTAGGAATGTAMNGLSQYNNGLIYTDITAVTGVLPTLDVYIDSKIDGTSWMNIGHFAAITTSGQYAMVVTKFAQLSTLLGALNVDLGQGTVRPMGWADEVRYRSTASGTSTFSGRIWFIAQG